MEFHSFLLRGRYKAFYEVSGIQLLRKKRFRYGSGYYGYNKWKYEGNLR